MTSKIDLPERDLGLALRRGMCRRCPQCGRGAMFSGYLKVADHCANCGLDLTPQRADDGPAYVVILIVGHIVGFTLPVFFTWFRDDPALLALIVSTLATALALSLLPGVKGAFVALQWAKGLHGFAPS